MIYRRVNMHALYFFDILYVDYSYSNAMKPNFSIVCIAKNEETTLPRLASSLHDFLQKGGEWVILDTGSTDNTVELARSLGAQVTEVGEMYLHTIDKELADNINDQFIIDGEDSCVKEGDTYFDFAAARNHAASMATNNVVSFVDCDEQFTNLDIEYLNKLIEDNPDVENFEYQFIFSHDQFGNPAIQFVQSKMYDRRRLCWRGIVHETLSPV